MRYGDKYAELMSEGLRQNSLNIYDYCLKGNKFSEKGAE